MSGTTASRIISAVVGPPPEGICGPMPEVKVIFENGEEKGLFTFYPDELSFTEEEFIGLTEKEAYDLKVKKDACYLLVALFQS